MARGWESKSIESQMEDAGKRRPGHTDQPPLAEDERKRLARHNQLQLSRTRILHEMQTACNTRFRAQLERELAFLDHELEKYQT